QNRLTVFSAQLSPVVSSEDSRLFGAIRSRQVAVIPARVDYALDLSQMDASRLRWDEATSTLDVQLPPLRVSRPNLDEGRAQYLREGIWITRDAQDSLTRQNTRLAEQQAVDQAANPGLLSLARSAARDAIRQPLAIPLSVSGFGRVTGNVRFHGEAVPARQGAPQGSQGSQYAIAAEGSPPYLRRTMSIETKLPTGADSRAEIDRLRRERNAVI